MKSMTKTYQIYQGKRPVLAALFFLAAAAIFFAGCEKPEDEVGLGLQPEGDNIDLFSNDTTTVNMITINEDSVRTDEFARGMLGNYTDPVFGVAHASFYTHLRLSSNNVDFGNPEDIVVDSLVLDFVLGNENYGNITPQSFSITQITEPIYRDSLYASNSHVETDTDNLILPDWQTQTVDPKQGGVLENGESYSLLKFHLDTELADVFINAGGTDDLANSQNFTEFFNGLYLKSESINNNMFAVNFIDSRTKMTMHYRDLGGDEADTLSFDFLINNECARFTRIEHGYGNTELAALQNGEDSLPGDQNLYIQAGGGVKTKITFPNILDYAVPEDRIINRAELVLPVKDNSVGIFNPISRIFLLNELSDGSVVFSLDQSIGNAHVGGFYDSTTGEYRFNITRHIQALIEGNLDSGVLYATPDHPNFYQNPPQGIFNARRVVINGTEVDEDRARLILTFTE